MKRFITSFLASTLWLVSVLPASADVESGYLLQLPARNITVDLKTGRLTTKGVEGECLEVVSKVGPHELVVSKSPGDDHPEVTVDGEIRHLRPEGNVKARLGTIRLARDGSLFYLRTWKSGQKQTELLKDGKILFSWKRGTIVKFIRMTTDNIVLLLDGASAGPRLVSYKFNETGSLSPFPKTLVYFGSCQPESLRIAGDDLWAQMSCTQGQKGIYKISLDSGDITKPEIANASAEFVSLPKQKGKRGLTVATVTGNQAGLHFYYATTGLLLGQTGEVRACSSDAAGLQSWNQSYRTRAHADLFKKTKVPAFANLAQKSIRLTLDAQNGANERSGPACGWGSTIYAKGNTDRLNLLINQAMIANSLSQSCADLGLNCPESLKSKVEDTQLCLAKAFEPDFDTALGLYRIPSNIDFKFAGAVAPWNWQVSFARLLHDLNNQEFNERASAIAAKFVSSWSQDENGSLWRYWPNSYYLEKGLKPDEVTEQRYEDTGHAGISLLALADMRQRSEESLTESIKRRTDALLLAGVRTPRDLDGSGPLSPKWFPAGGWANHASASLRKAYAAPVPSRSSADAVYAYGQLFDPAAAFSLKLEIHRCQETCQIESVFTYGSWKEFLKQNPFFVLSGAIKDETQLTHSGSFSFN